jgi:hypothetical protein
MRDFMKTYFLSCWLGMSAVILSGCAVSEAAQEEHAAALQQQQQATTPAKQANGAMTITTPQQPSQPHNSQNTGGATAAKMISPVVP